jgi:hypothetical protein
MECNWSTNPSLAYGTVLEELAEEIIMGENENESECGCGGQCNCGCGDETGANLGPWLWNAYRAHNELLRDKIKAKFEAEEGPWLDEVAGLLVELVNLQWKGEREFAQKEKAIREKLEKLLNE